ncbi:Protein of uncharacterised function (DUF445) [Sebaldella termitidis]|mgnify:FL=1|uniref:YheB n=1 Tax=Sebaldella termitidis (strain ATCC 33386 / NCTC 11300) TaxID=526218 RepID=D1AJZ9_SEBTE|nr:DUF445 family protein [Sebaldella termitidis]ACZ07056.1 conserved hypothetical protein [Sebaldella termitidis ATCC 33386]SUI22346.1 Protein of uncharacterised function (DUF445) [Sebaldella termitidis]
MDRIAEFLLMVGVGALIGWFTNYLAIRLLFRPYNEINLVIFKLQGLIPKRRHEIAVNIAEVIETELISIREIGDKLDTSSFEYDDLDDFLDRLVKEKIKAELLEKNPFLKMFMNDGILNKMRDYIKKLILDNKEELFQLLLKSIEKNVDLKGHIIEKMDNFSLREIEDIIIKISKKELKHIEILGGILGGIIAVFQYLIITIIR